MANTKLIIAWLNDAYGMEQAQVEMLERFIKDYDDFPTIQARLEEHLHETKQQIEDIKACLDGLDAKPSATKSIMGNMMGKLQGMSTGPYKDEIVRNMIMVHAGEHFEHATYLTLVASARELEFHAIADTCARIAEEESEMAEWSEERLPEVVVAVVEQYGEK